MKQLLALARRLLAACALGMLASVLLPATAQAATCAPAATQGTAPADFRTYCWFDFSTYNDTTASGLNYYYVTAVNAAGESGPSTVQSGAPNQSAPGTPTNLTGTVIQ